MHNNELQRRMRRAGALGTLMLGIAYLPGCDAGDRRPAGEKSQPAAASTPKLRTVESADGVEIAYTVKGQGDTALVFIHGWSCDARYWHAQLRALSDGFTLVTLDLAGHGASGADRREWSMGAFGEDVAAVVRALPNRRVILIGHSLGGYVALEAARRLPNRAIGIVGVDTLQDLDGRVIDEAAAQALMSSLRRAPQETTRNFVSETFFTLASDPALVRDIANDMASAPPEVSLPSMETLIRYDPKPVAASLRIPIVAINSGMSPVDVAAAQRLVPRFDAVNIPDTGHFLHMEKPVEFNAALNSTIARILRMPAPTSRRPA